MIRFRLYIIGRSSTEVMLYMSHCIPTGRAWFGFVLLLIMLTLILWLRWLLPSFFTPFAFILHEVFLRDTWEPCKYSHFPLKIPLIHMLICVYRCLVSYFTQWVAIHYYDYLLEVQIVLDLGFTLASVSCWGLPIFLVFFVIVFWRQQMFQAHLVISLLQPWNQPFLQGVLVPFTGE